LPVDKPRLETDLGEPLDAGKAWSVARPGRQRYRDQGLFGNTNDLNASYATDAYARINGIGGLIVTHGVGALSAINGIAGAYSEHVPVILISGSLPLRAIQRGDLMHHTLADREKREFLSYVRRGDGRVGATQRMPLLRSIGSF
jgi:hypothetical protein